jgi:hypothetical protein
MNAVSSIRARCADYASRLSPAPLGGARESHRYTVVVRVPEAILASIVRVAATSPEITAVYVFGSQAAGSARADSDVDLGVLYANRQPLETTLALEEAFGGRPAGALI